MIYLDTSVAMAALFAKPRRPPETIWSERLVASRLLEYEVMVRVNARSAGSAAAAAARTLLDGVALVDLDASVLARAVQPFPVPVRTLDALHLATLEFLRGQGQSVELATYDRRLGRAAQALGFALSKV